MTKWLFFVHESDLLCFECSSIPTSCFIEKSANLQSLSKCVGRYFKEHVLTLVVN